MSGSNQKTQDFDINDRTLLQALRKDAQAQMACPNLQPNWMQAYQDFAAAVDRLDAMWARTQVAAPKTTMHALFDGSEAQAL